MEFSEVPKSPYQLPGPYWIRLFLDSPVDIVLLAQWMRQQTLPLTLPVPSGMLVLLCFPVSDAHGNFSR